MRKTSRKARFPALPLASRLCWNPLANDWHSGTFLRKKLPAWRPRAKSERRWKFDSPVSGYITERNALPNLMVQPDTRLYTVADLSTVWVLAQVFQNDLGRIKVGSPASLTVDSYPGRVFRGRVDFIYPDVDMTTRTARARLVFSNSQLTLSPGMFVNVNRGGEFGKAIGDSCERSACSQDRGRLFSWIVAAVILSRVRSNSALKQTMNTSFSRDCKPENASSLPQIF